jgi:hypothetical protein
LEKGDQGGFGHDSIEFLVLDPFFQKSKLIKVLLFSGALAHWAL